MKELGRRFAVVGFVVCVAAMTYACGTRSTAAGAPAAPQPTQPPATPSPVVPTPEPPSPSPAPIVPRADTSDLDCALIVEPGEPITTVALSDQIEPSNAPRPSNDSERLLFRQVYETLIRVDCNGRIRPGLARSWRRDTDEPTWIVTLRENARFSDGTPVTPADVRASWTRDGTGELQPPVSRLVQSIAPIDDRSFAITLRSHRVDAPLAFAHPDLAVAKRVVGAHWPLGTRTDRAALEEGAATAVVTKGVITVMREKLAPVRFVVATGDARDLLDSDVDLLLTRDSATLRYAATLPQFQSVPLEWQRIHVLVAPGRTRDAASMAEDERRKLALDAVRGDARGAVGPFWWQMLEDCDVAGLKPLPYDISRSPARQQPLAPRIVYDARDDVGRDLAERFVGLRTYQRASALTSDALASARRRGSDAAYVMSLDRRPLDPCRDLQALVDGAPWLDPETIVPLVETRPQAIVRRGRSGVSAEWDGALLLTGVNVSK